MKLGLLPILLIAVFNSYGQNESPNFESFELPVLPECWQAIDEDGDDFNWGVFYLETNDVGVIVPGKSGVGSLTSASFDNAEGALEPDNYLILPHLDVQSGEDFSYYVGGLDPLYSLEHYSVLLSTSGDSPEEFTDTLIAETLTTHSFQLREIDLAAYEGMQVYIAFNHHDSSNQFQIRIDDVQYPTTVNECEILVSLEEEEILNKEFLIYPNPSNGAFTLKVQNVSIDEIIVIGIDGKELMRVSEYTNQNEVELDLSHLKSGFYSVLIKENENILSQRVLIY